MMNRFALAIGLTLLLFVASVSSKSIDPYKVLGVERSASQREIQKAFHKLSLQYHPDKNKSKGAQQKFEEISNAYDILSDEVKRNNYDQYGDERGNPGFNGENMGNHGGYTYFTHGGPGQGGSSFGPDEWQTMGGGGPGSSKSFSFSFGGGGPSNQRSFSFGLDDIFSNFFGGDLRGGSRFGGFGGWSSSQSGFGNSPRSISSVTSQVYKNEIADKGITWILLSFTPSTKGTHQYESILEEIFNTLEGALKVGGINCGAESSFCKELGMHPRGSPRVFVYSYKTTEAGSLTEYNGDMTAKSLKRFCQDHLPGFSKRVNLDHFDPSSDSVEPLPKVILLSTKKDTPVIWRALSGLYHKRFTFYDTEVHDVSDPSVRRLGVDSLPALVGWLSNREKHVLKAGISVIDIKSAIQELSAALEDFEKWNKKAASTKSKKEQADSRDSKIPLLARSNFDEICGEKIPVCIIGAFRSSKAGEKLEAVVSSVSQKSLLRRQNGPSSSRDSVSYALLDASKQPSFLASFDKSGFKSLEILLLAYKPKREKFAAFDGEATTEAVESFVGSVLNGDVQFTKIRIKPNLK